MRILVVKVSALGDIVHALPVLPYLHSACPGVEIDWLAEEGFAPLLEGHPLLRRVHRLRTRAWRRDGIGPLRKGMQAILRDLRRERYDLALDLQGNSKSGLFTLLSGARRRVGFDRSGVREWPNLLSTNGRIPLGEGDFHISDRSLALARGAVPGGKADPCIAPLSADPAASAAVERRLEECGFGTAPVVVLHYGTTWTTKLWPLDSWCEVASRLVRERGVRPLLTWGNDAERSAAEAIREACGGEAVVWPRGTLPELVALLGRADLVVGGDTGPVHIAAAVGTPTVSLYRVTDARRNGPRGDRHIRLQAPLECSPCLRKDCERDAECGRSISVGDVFDAIEEQFSAGMGAIR